MQIPDKYKEYKTLVHAGQGETIDLSRHPLGQKEGKKTTKNCKIFHIHHIEKAGGKNLETIVNK
jgi:hypothetical protein